MNRPSHTDEASVNLSAMIQTSIMYERDYGKALREIMGLADVANRLCG